MPNDLQHALRDAEQALTASRWLRVSTVCRRLDVSKLTIYRWIDRGAFREGDLVRTPGGHWRIRESAITHLEREGAPKHAA